MASLRKICLVIKVMKQKRLISKVNHVKHTVFFDPLSETAFCTGMYSIYGICLFRQAMKRGYTEFDRSEICFIFSLSRWTKLVTSLSKIWFQKSYKLITALRDHYENANERKAHANEIALRNCDLRSQLSFARQSRWDILQN